MKALETLLPPKHSNLATFIPNIADHVLMVFMGIILPFFAVFKSQPDLKNIEFDTSTKLSVYYSNSLMLWLPTIIIFVLWWWTGRPFADLGLPWPIPAISQMALLLYAVFILLYAADVLLELRNDKKRAETLAHWKKRTPFLPETGYEFKHFMVVCISAGVCEEVIFRGYFMTYFASVLGDADWAKVLTVLLPAFIFAFAHLYQGWKVVFKISVMAVLFGLIFLLSGTIWWLIVLHFWIDFIGGALGWWLFSKERE